MPDRTNVLKLLARSIVLDESFEPEQLSNRLAAKDCLQSWLSPALINHQLALEKWPQPVRTAYYFALHRNETHMYEIDQILSAQSLSDRKVIPLKGCWMLRKALINPGQRDFCDIDIWAKEDFLVAKETLLSLGYHEHTPFHNRVHFHAKFIKPSSPWPILVELHKDLTLSAYHRLNDQEIWRNCSQSRNGDWELSAEDLLIYTFLHSSQEFFCRSSRLLDCALVWRWSQEQGVLVAHLLEKLERWKVKRWFLLSLLLLEWATGKNMGSLLFPKNHIEVAIRYRDLILPQLHCDKLSLSGLHSYFLADSQTLGIAGIINPRRWVGGLLDKLE